MFISCITKLLQLCPQSEKKLQLWKTYKCFDMNCTTPRLFHYFALSEAKHYSSRNSRMSLPLSSKQLCCRQTPPNIYFSNKGPPTCLQLPVYDIQEDILSLWWKWGVIDLYPFRWHTRLKCGDQRFKLINPSMHSRFWFHLYVVK
jgi:hypothetical protein